MTGLAWDWSAFNTGHLWVALFTLLYIDLLDCTGCLFSMAKLLDFEMPGFLDENMEFPGQVGRCAALRYAAFPPGCRPG